MVLAANLVLVGGLLGVGLVAHSLGLWAEGVDYLADAAGVGVVLLALRFDAPTARRPDGTPRLTRYAALVNAGWLLVLNGLVVAGAIARLVRGVHEVRGLPVLVVSAVAATVMIASALLLGDDDGSEGEGGGGGGGQLAIRAVLLDTVADAAAAAGVAAAGAVIVVTGGTYWLDPVVALVVASVVGFHAVRLVGQVRASLQG